MYNLFLTHHTHSWPVRRPQKPTKAHSSQRRPTQGYEEETKMKKAPYNDRCIVLAIGKFFLKCTIYFLPTTPIVGPDDAHKSPQRPTAANEGQRRPMKMKKGPNNASWAIGKYFL